MSDKIKILKHKFRVFLVFVQAFAEVVKIFLTVKIRKLPPLPPKSKLF